MRAMKTYITVTRLAKACGCSRQYIHQAIREGKVTPKMMVGRTYIFTYAEAKKFQDTYFPM